MKIRILTFDPSLAGTLHRSAPSGVKVERSPTQGGKGVGYQTATEVVIHVASIGKDVAVGVLSAWLYDYLKKAWVQRVEINGRETSVSEKEISSALELKITDEL